MLFSEEDTDRDEWEEIKEVGEALWDSLATRVAQSVHLLYIGFAQLKKFSFQILFTGPILCVSSLGGQSQRHWLQRAPERRADKVSDASC